MNAFSESEDFIELLEMDPQKQKTSEEEFRIRFR